MLSARSYLDTPSRLGGSSPDLSESKSVDGLAKEGDITPAAFDSPTSLLERLRELRRRHHEKSPGRTPSYLHPKDSEPASNFLGGCFDSPEPKRSETATTRSNDANFEAHAIFGADDMDLNIDQIAAGMMSKADALGRQSDIMCELLAEQNALCRGMLGTNSVTPRAAQYGFDVQEASEPTMGDKYQTLPAQSLPGKDGDAKQEHVPGVEETLKYQMCALKKGVSKLSGPQKSMKTTISGWKENVASVTEHHQATNLNHHSEKIQVHMDSLIGAIADMSKALQRGKDKAHKASQNPNLKFAPEAIKVHLPPPQPMAPGLPDYNSSFSQPSSNVQPAFMNHSTTPFGFHDFPGLDDFSALDNFLGPHDFGSQSPYISDIPNFIFHPSDEHGPGNFFDDPLYAPEMHSFLPQPKYAPAARPKETQDMREELNDVKEKLDKLTLKVNHPANEQQASDLSKQIEEVDMKGQQLHKLFYTTHDMFNERKAFEESTRSTLGAVQTNMSKLREDFSSLEANVESMKFTAANGEVKESNKLGVSSKASTPSTCSAKPAPPDHRVCKILAKRGSHDGELYSLMKVVATGDASQAQLKAFQAHIDQIAIELEGKEKETQVPVSKAPVVIETSKSAA